MAEPDSPAVVGGCYCGQVQYQSKEPAYGMTLCYCSMCRYFHGGPFAPFTNVRRQHLQWTRTEGLESLAFSNVATRTICRSCRAPITMVYHAEPDEISLVASSINEDQSAAPIPEIGCHIYVGDKQSWYKILDNAPQLPGPSPKIQGDIEEALQREDTLDSQIIRRG